MSRKNKTGEMTTKKKKQLGLVDKDDVDLHIGNKAHINEFLVKALLQVHQNCGLIQLTVVKHRGR